MENEKISSFEKSGVGYLVVRVSTALGAIPLENAAVHIRGGSAEASGVLYSLLSDRDGLTEKVALPTPPRSRSLLPSASAPFSAWSIEVQKEGYIPLLFEGVPIYPDTVSVQPAVLVPRGERTLYGQTYVETTHRREEEVQP